MLSALSVFKCRDLPCRDYGVLRLFSMHYSRTAPNLTYLHVFYSRNEPHRTSLICMYFTAAPHRGDAPLDGGAF
jgi:hypothetical protein